MIRILAFLLAFALRVLAADQAPDVAFALTQQFRPDTNFRTCRSTGNVKANCGFCYGPSGSFLGWNCACDAFVSTVADVRAGSRMLILSSAAGPRSEYTERQKPLRFVPGSRHILTFSVSNCYYILESDPSNYAKVTCQA